MINNKIIAVIDNSIDENNKLELKKDADFYNLYKEDARYLKLADLNPCPPTTAKMSRASAKTFMSARAYWRGT